MSSQVLAEKTFKKCPACGEMKKKRYEGERCWACKRGEDRWGHYTGMSMSYTHLIRTSGRSMSSYKPSQELVDKIKYVFKYLLAEPLYYYKEEKEPITAARSILFIMYLNQVKGEEWVKSGRQLTLYMAYTLTSTHFFYIRDDTKRRENIRSKIEEHILPLLLKEVSKVKSYMVRKKLQETLTLQYNPKLQKKGYKSLEEVVGPTAKVSGKWVTKNKLNPKTMMHETTEVWVEQVEQVEKVEKGDG